MKTVENILVTPEMAKQKPKGNMIKPTPTKPERPKDGYLLKHEVAARLRKQPRTFERWMQQRLL
jgi:hypothetical protein